MSDSSNSALGILANWKIGLAISVPCFALGFGITYYYCKKKSAVVNATAAKDRVESGVKEATTEQNTLPQTSKEHAIEMKIQGNQVFMTRNFGEAIALFTQGLSACPESEKDLLSILFLNRAVAYSKLNNHVDSLLDCDRAVALDPLYTKAISWRARVLKKLGKYELAIEDITAVIMMDNHNIRHDILFSHTLMDLLTTRNIEEYKNNTFFLPDKRHISKFLENFCDNLYNNGYSQLLMESDVNSGLELALKCVRDKNYERIEEACKEELNKTDNDLIRRTLTLNLLGTIYILSGNSNAALEHLTTVIETPEAPNELVINSLIKRARVYFGKLQDEKCFEDFKRAETINPNSPVVFHYRAQFHLNKEGHEEDAIKDLERAVELNPSFVLSNIQLSYALFVHGYCMSYDWDAMRHLRKLKEFLNKDPLHVESYRLYAKALKTLSYYSEADFLLRKAHEMCPEDTDYLVERSMVSQAWKNEFDCSFKYLEQALEIDPKSGYAYEHMGFYYYKMGQCEKAFECYEKAIQFCRTDKLRKKIFEWRNATYAQIQIVKRFNMKPGVIYYSANS